MISGETLDLGAGILSLVLTLCIFSYLLGDNFLYRTAVHILVGATAGYIMVIALESAVLPWINLTILGDEGTSLGARIFGVFPFLLGLSLLLKYSPTLAPLGNLGMAFIVGVGTAVAIVGATAGTIAPLIRATNTSFDEHNLLNALVIAFGTVGTLVYFQYLAKRRVDGSITRRRPLQVLAWVGQGVVMITFGALYAGIMLTSLSVFSGVIAQQLAFILKQIG